MDLYEACENGNEERVVELLVYGDSSGYFHHPSSRVGGASQARNTQVISASTAVRMLKARSTAGRTPLLAACMHGQVSVVRLLLGESCLVYFTSRDMEETSELLHPLGAEYTDFAQTLPHEVRIPNIAKPLFQVTMEAKEGDTDAVPTAFILLPPNRVIAPQDLLGGRKHVDDFGNTPLQCISCFGCGSADRHIDDGLEITKLLLFQGDQPNLAKIANKWTPLHWSAYNGNHEQCAILLNPRTRCPQGAEGRRIGKTQFSIPLFVNSDNLFAADVAGRRGLALLKEMNALRKLPPFKRSKYAQWRLRLDHIQVLRLFTQEFLENAPELVAYVNDMNSRLPLHLFAKKKAPRFAVADAIRYGQHLLYWMGCFGLVEEVQALLALKLEVPTGGDTLTRSTFAQLQPLYVCSCEENKRQSVLHAVAVHGQQDIVRLLLSFLVFAQLNPVLAHVHQPKDSPKKNVVVPFDDLDPLGKVEEQVGRDVTQLDVLPLATAGWRNYRNESPLFLAVLFLQYEVVVVFRQFLTAESLVWELGNCNVEGSFIHHVANDELRHDLGLHTTEATSSQRLKCTEYVLLFDGLKKKQFKESMIETLREESVLSPSLQILKAGHKIHPARLCGLISVDRTDYVVVGATDEVLIRHAQALQLKIKHRGSSIRSKYDASSAHVFEPFRSLHRQQVVLDIIQKQVNLNKHLKRGNLRAIFPLHDVSGCKNIVRNWVRTDAQKRIFQPFNETSLKQFLLERRTHQYEMLWPLLTYFGEKHAFYYAFMMFYTVWLLLIAVPGAVCQLLSSLEIASSLSPLFAIIVSLWATLLVERWKRKRSEIQTNFGNFKRNRNEESPEFYGDFQVISPEKSIVDITFPKSLQLLRFYLGIPVLLTMASAVVVIFIGVKLNASSTTILREVFPWMPSLLVPYVIPVLNAISMLILDYVYTYVAIELTQWENHRTVWQYESMLATKLFWFKFLNAFISLFWVAFVERKPTALRDQLIVIMGTRQIWYSFQRHIFPLIAVTQKWKAAGFRDVQTAGTPKKQTWLTTLTSSLTPEWYHMEMTMDPEPTKPAVDTTVPDKDKVTGEAPAAGGVPPIVLLQELMQPPDFLMGKQMELVLQYGYITMFVSVLPLAPLLALLSNVINTRLDVISCTQVKRRPQFESETEVSTFMNILEFMSFAAVAVNCAVLFFTSSQAFESLLVVFTSHQSVAATSYVTKLWILLVTEHGVLALKALLSLTIDDAATWVQNEEDRDDDDAKQSAQQERARSGLVDVATLETDYATEIDTAAQDLEALVNETLGQGDSAINQHGDDKALHRLLADKYASAIRDREAAIEREQQLRMELDEYVRAEHGGSASQNCSTRHTIRSPDAVQDKQSGFATPIASSRECCAICFILLTRCVVESLKRCLSCRQFLCVNCDAVVHLDDLGVSEPLHCRVSIPVGGYKRHGMAGHFSSAQRTDRADLETLSQLRTMVAWFVQQEEFHTESLPTETAAVDTIVARSEAAAPLILRYLLNQKRTADPDSQ